MIESVLIRYSLFATRHSHSSHDHFADQPGIVLREEQPAVGEGGDAARAAGWCRNIVFAAYDAVRRHAADLVGEVRGVPEVAVGADRDAAQRRIRRRHRMLGDAAVAVDAAERVGRGLDEPDAAVGMRRHGARLAVVTRNRELRDVAVYGDAADAVAGGFGEPQRAVA